MSRHDARSKRAAFRLGLRAETIAAWYMRLCGYRILDRRYRTPAGEIDIVARRGDALCFVEVKARRSVSAALDAVTLAAQRRIGRAARIWLAGHPGHERCAWRFDIIAIRPWSLPVHIPAAFQEP